MPGEDITTSNRFLASLPGESLQRLRPHFHPLDLPLRMVLFEMGDPAEHVFFMARGMTSLLIRLEDGALLEVGVVGREGAVGLAALMGARSAPHTGMIQIPGKGARIEAGILRDEMLRSAGVLDPVLRWTQALNAQVSQTAACNAHHTLQERLARWLLMAHDRAEDDALPLTQDFLSMMLGVRRAGVTVAANVLQQAGAISYRRGRIAVLDRSGLEEVSCECYAMVTRQIRALLADDGIAEPGSNAIVGINRPPR
ncbi:Crp/Fnr family transcriptional regulator [Arenibaculum sp.]|uniref:Crp/Fnr family transcriptional regulator n=1 Tax=Arenibaculum sp. TaxID=2865862 RepID=UPI002E0FFBDA|nr:Crp/Fnr family transcriptional regulator [Arenibaculum sp.]